MDDDEGVFQACKHALQLMLDAFSRHTDISAAWGRIIFLYGPGGQTLLREIR